MNTKAKGARAERRCIRILEAAGYRCTHAAASLGLFDVIALGPDAVRLIQVKAGGEYLSAVEREQIQLLLVPKAVSKECWRFPQRAKTPLIERL